MPNFQRDGINFYFAEHGSGFPFIFSHGLTGDLNRAYELLDDLPNYRLILYDNRGHGRTTPLGDPSKLNFNDMADDMAAVLEHLGISSAIVGGVSMGCGISLAFSLRHGQRAKALILSRPAWLDKPNPPGLAAHATIAKLVQELGVEKAFATFEQMDVYRTLRQNDPESADSLRGLFSEENLERAIATLRAIPAFAPVDSFAKLKVLATPALVLGCHNDFVHPFEYAEVLAKALPAARLREIPPKTPSLAEHERQFRRLVTEFLSSLD